MIPRWTTFARDGLRRSPVGERPEVVMATLADPAFVTHALDDLLDQRRSRTSPPIQWAIPTVRLGARTVEVVLEPHWSTSTTEVVIAAPSTPDSDADADLRLQCRSVAVDTGRSSELTIGYELELGLRLLPAVAVVARPALDRSIDRIVDEITGRIIAAIERG